MEQSGTAKCLPGQVLLNWLTAAADGHGGIQNIAKLSTIGLVDTYRITLADTTTFDFVVTNGRGINSIAKTSTSGLVDTYTIEYNDGTTGTFTVKNGEKGDKGDNTYTWIKYASQEPTESSHSMGDIPDEWRGEYNGPLSSPPTDWKAYKWYKIKGDKGDTGDPATLTNKSVTYQVSDSGTITPSGEWGTRIPVVAQGKYLWTKTEIQFNSGDQIVSYSVSRMGMDGSGSVSTVCGVSPDVDGNVVLTASDVGALADSGGDMTGELRMNGQPISGLNDPTEESQAARKGYVDASIRKAAPYNYAHNSDFTQFVAQAGVGGLHGTQAYAGDRWILDSGTVSGTANENGNGYRNITLNGTIRQIIANPPAVGTAGVEMISGTAAVSYTDGELIITSSGGIIKNVLLCASETLPEYQPKGYRAEFSECQMYYQIPVQENLGYGYIFEAKTAAIISIPISIKMRTVPSVKFDGISVRYSDKTLYITDANNVIVFENGSTAIRINIAGTYEVAGVVAVASASNFAFDADL